MTNNTEKMRTVLTEMLKAQYNPPSVAGIVADDIITRLEVEGLLIEGTAGAIDRGKFEFSTGWWSRGELDQCSITHNLGMDYHEFKHPDGRKLKLYDEWIINHTAEGIAYMVDLVHKKSGEIK